MLRVSCRREFGNGYHDRDGLYDSITIVLCPRELHAILSTNTAGFEPRFTGIHSMRRVIMHHTAAILTKVVVPASLVVLVVPAFHRLPC